MELEMTELKAIANDTNFEAVAGNVFESTLIDAKTKVILRKILAENPNFVADLKQLHDDLKAQLAYTRETVDAGYDGKWDKKVINAIHNNFLFDYEKRIGNILDQWSRLLDRYDVTTIDRTSKPLTDSLESVSSAFKQAGKDWNSGLYETAKILELNDSNFKKN
jgi:hypothetical protein